MPVHELLNRRALLAAGLSLPWLCSPLLSACAGNAASPARRGTAIKASIALLLPLTGTRAVLGNMMAEAAELAQAGSGDLLTLDRFDTGGTADGAAQAAQAAMDKGAGILIGPVFSAASVAAARIVEGRVPLISFSNDSQLRNGTPGQAGLSSQRPAQLFQIGLESLQPVSAIIRYAMTRGIRRFGLAAKRGSAWDMAVMAAADGTMAQESGMSFTNKLLVDPDMLLVDVMARLRSDSGILPDAVLIPSQGALFERLAPRLIAEGVQPLSLLQGYARPDSLAGAWAAAPDPGKFFTFAELFQASFGTSPGYLAALAHDAVSIVRQLAENGAITAAGLTRGEGFTGVGGRYRFSPDGFCRRDLVILADGEDGPEIVEGAAR